MNFCNHAWVRKKQKAINEHVGERFVIVKGDALDVK